uniref:Ovule protein n=1 Tax=Globodera pallida TaxID=36090 RepID=A0A183CPA4_GLOPA
MSSTNLKELKEGAFQTTVPGMEKLYMRKMKYLWKIGTNAFTGLKKLKVELRIERSVGIITFTVSGL